MKKHIVRHAKSMNSWVSSASVAIGGLIASGYITDPRVMKGMAIAGIVLSAFGFQRPSK